MERQISLVKDEALAALRGAQTSAELEAIRVKYLGKKGELTLLLRGMGKVPPEERPRLGKLVNEARDELERALGEAGRKLAALEEEQRLERERVDITLPGRRPPMGHKHPLTLVLEEIKHVFRGMGFDVVQGPEVETDYYNFEALNVPKFHPARDMQDTFYITDDILLRTQTSPVQARVMEQRKPPIRIIAPGKVYRRDADVTHSPMFHQVEGLAVDKHITFGDLKGVLKVFAEELFGKDTGMRFRPSYFPFTEPSAEVDISCVMCHGEGCRVCSHSGWLEILGAGMVHPRVLEMAGYDPEEVGGFAFGMGIERIAMLKYGVDDIRLFFENDARFLTQF
ncbi:MAG: phenylalanine--tRNA ligase subunit alpha [Firmicutes bacterium]|jgi:phenylalanyl-tRNA synthetase alpha chain|nr:phenylalanine--tRNA ligase subunit alpha [Bacillota bacterium]